MKIFSRIVIVSALFFLFGFFGLASAKTTTTSLPKKITKQYTRIFYCQNGKSALQSLQKNYSAIDVLAPQAYSINVDGVLSGGIDEKLLAVARSRKIKIMPLIVNKGFNSRTAHTFLDDPDKQALAIQSMVDEGIKEKFWGWQVDFEQIDITYRDKFTAFVKLLTDRLHENNMISSVAVIAQTSTEPKDYPKDYWFKFIGVYDFGALASSSDFISLMSYDDPGSKGPVTRYTWLKQVLDFTLKSVPPEKVSVGIPLYYWRWNDTTKKRVAVGTYKQMLSKMNSYNTKKGYDEVEETAYLRYKSNKMTYTIWYENSRSVAKKVELIKDLGLHGFSAWALGQEVPNIFNGIFSNSYLAFED